MSLYYIQLDVKQKEGATESENNAALANVKRGMAAEVGMRSEEFDGKKIYLSKEKLDRLIEKCWGMYFNAFESIPESVDFMPYKQTVTQ